MKIPGPVRSLIALDEDRMIILGQVYEYGAEDLTKGMDYIKVLNLSDGTTNLLYLQVYPEDIYHLVAVPGKGVLISIENWLVFWDTVDPEATIWRTRIDTPSYITLMGSEHFLTVSKDTRGLNLFELKTSALVTAVRTEAAVTGAPEQIDKLLLVPTVNGFVEYTSALDYIEKIPVANLRVGTQISISDGGVYLSDSVSISFLTK